MSVAYSPDGRYIISGSYDKTIRIWNAETGSSVGTPLEGTLTLVRSVAYSPDGRHIISGSYDKTIRIWNAETGSAVGMPLEGHTGMVHQWLTLPMGCTSSLGPLTRQFGSGMPRLALQSASLYRGTLIMCSQLLTHPMGGTYFWTR
jgi:WD40 repeat protein